MTVRQVTTAICDVCGRERDESEVYRIRVATIPTKKVLAGGQKVEGTFEPLSIKLDVPFEDICADCLKEKRYAIVEKPEAPASEPNPETASSPRGRQRAK